MEKLQVFNANLKSQGFEERGKVHMEGLWHKTFHCWLLSKEAGGSILFQLRSMEKKSYPNLLDISAAGHLVDNEDVADGIREVSEELGIDIHFKDLYSLGYRVEVDDAESAKNREYQAVYIGEVNKSLQDFTPQVAEVSGLVWLRIEDALSLFDGKRDIATVNGISYNRETQTWDRIERCVSVDDFIPRLQKYYLTIAIMADRYMKGQFPLAIS
jgi:isopentenyldiphosphate isomerase